MKDFSSLSALAKRVVRQLEERGQTVALAESCTGGLVAKTLTDVSGASNVFECGVVAYSEAIKQQVNEQSARLAECEAKEAELAEKIKQIMMKIPNIIDPSVPIGKDDSENVEVQRYGEPVVPEFDIPYHTEIMEKFNGIDLDAARKVAGNGFYYLMGDIARLHSAVISYARDFMIDRGFTYVVPPFMIRSNVVTGVMSFAEMDAMMYKIEGEDLYLIGTSEHSMIGKFIDQIVPEEKLTLISVFLTTSVNVIT